MQTLVHAIGIVSLALVLLCSSAPPFTPPPALAQQNSIFTNPRLFVIQQYRDLLGREGDPETASTTGPTSLPQAH